MTAFVSKIPPTNYEFKEKDSGKKNGLLSIFNAKEYLTTYEREFMFYTSTSAC